MLVLEIYSIDTYMYVCRSICPYVVQVSSVDYELMRISDLRNVDAPYACTSIHTYTADSKAHARIYKHMHIQLRAHTHAYTIAHTHTCIYNCAHTHACKHAFTHAHFSAHTHMHMHFTSARTHVHTYTSAHTLAYMGSRAHTHIHVCKSRK